MCPSDIREKNAALKLYNNHFYLLWKSDRISFNKSMEEFRVIFQIVDNYDNDGNDISYFDYEYKPEKKESQVTNFFVYGLETNSADSGSHAGFANTNRARPYCVFLFILSKLARKYNHDLTLKNLKNMKKILWYLMEKNVLLKS